METSFKSITNIQRWRLAAITLGSALVLAAAGDAFSMGAAPVINSPKTATGQVGVAFSYQITATNSPTSFGTTVSIPGVNFSTTTGLFSGTPTTAGTFSGNITATNPSGTGTQTLAVTINPQAPVVTSAGTATGQVGVAFSYQIQATNNPTGFGTTVSIPGVNFSTATGAFSGTPTTAGPFSGNITATNAGGTGTKTLAVTINPPAPTVTSSGTASGTVGDASFSYHITANQAIPSGGWGTTVSVPGVSFSTATGAFSGTPTTAGTFSGNITATNANGTGTKALAVTIAPPPHTNPTAVAAISPPALYAGDTVTLDSTGSHTNPSGGTLTYTWQQVAPASPAISLLHQGDPIATFAAPAPPVGDNQLVTFTLRVRDSAAPGSSQFDTSDELTTTVYALPTANAGPDQAVDQGTTVYLNGSSSTGVSLTYAWTAPAGITLSDSTAPNPTFIAPSFTPPNGASYTFTLVVTEHRIGFPPKVSAGDQVVIMVKQPPMAFASFVNDPNNITAEGTVNESSCTTLTNVTLYGFGTDPDTDQLTFSWTQVHDTGGTALGQGDTMVALDDNTSATPSFTAPDLTNGIQQVDLVFQLTVNDGTINSAPSYVTIHVLNINDPPAAVASASPAPAPEGSTVTLDGSGSFDPNQGDMLTYTWTQVGGTPSVTLTPLGSNATFTAPSVETTLSFVLTVTDHYGCSDQKPVDVTVIQNNHPPVAQAGSDQTVPAGNQACLDGSASFDPDVGDTLTYIWTQIDGPTVTLDNTSPSQPCFTTPIVGPAGATLHFHLTVTDNHGASSTDVSPPNYPTVAVNVTYVNHPPSPDAGPDQNVNEADTVHLDGSNSTDPDGNPLTYLWTQVGGNTSVTIVPDPVDPSKATFVAPRVTCAGDKVVMRLTVDDMYFDGVRTDDVNINVANTNLPTANAGGNQPAPGDPPVKEGDTVSLHGTGDDGDPEEVPQLTFQWNQTSGLPLVTLSPSSGKDVSFTAPTIPGGDPNASLDLGFSLTVTDSCGGFTTTDPITVHVANIPHAPVAVVTGPANVNEGGDSGQLNGSTSYDPDNDPITYAWTQTAGPSVMLDDPSSPTPTFTTPWVSANTPVTFKLTATDPYGLTNSASITVTIVNWHTPPDASHATADVGVLWPPDHKMAQVHIVGVVKPSDDHIAITKVTQDEPTNGLGDGDTAIDAVKQANASGDDSVLLRAERSGKGNGRVYRVCFHIDDPEQSADGCVNVSVPHDKKTDIAIDSGQTYDSTH